MRWLFLGQTKVRIPTDWRIPVAVGARQRRLDPTCMLAIVMAAWSILAPARLGAEERRPVPVLPGHTFQSAESQRLQNDDGANPGMLWVEQGAALWTAPAEVSGKSCASCHGDAAQSMKGVAARYPAVDTQTGRLLNIELRINQCRTANQGAPALAWESDALLGLTAFVSWQSLGLPKTVHIDGPARPFFEAGRTFFAERQGQLNVACTLCHDDNAGRRLRGDLISQGQTEGWPAYRLEWQKLGSLSRRIRACSMGVRAEILDFGAPEYLALELYLAWRGEGLALSSPGVRR